MLLMMTASLTFFSRAAARIAVIGRMVVLLALALSVQPLLGLQAAAQDDVGLPMHPRANAPYKQVVRFYREKVGRDAQISQIDSGKLLNTLILASRDPADQFNVNISSELGKKVTQVELSRNSARP
jgi:hypothetical protein